MLDRRQLFLATAALAAAPLGALAQQPQQPATPASAAPAALMPVVATFSILADVATRIGGERIGVTSLVPPGGDAHVYQPTPADSRALVGARIVIVNGLGFEGWINRLIRSSGTKATVVTASRGVRALRTEGGHNHGHSHGHSHGENDPHVWQDVANVKIFAANIRDALKAVDPEGAAGHDQRAAAYIAELDTLDRDIRTQIARIPADRRKIITAHDAFQYFEKAYGVEFISPRGVSTSAEPSPQAVARIINQIRRERIGAVFLENIADQRVIQRIATETGARIGGTLFSDALTPPGGPAPSYVALMRHNVGQIVSALAPTG